MKIKKDENKKRIKIGLFGFGKTGRIVAKEFIEDSLFDLKWVMRRTHKENHKYAISSFGI